VLNPDGSVRQWVGVHTDVTDEFEAKARLAESEARLQAVFEAVPVGIVVASAPNGEIVDGNKQTERIVRHELRYSGNVESYAGWTAYHADGRPVQAEEYPLARVIRGEEEHPEMEALYHRGDGTEGWVRIIGGPIRGEQGDLIGGVVALLDIDREKRAEAQLRELNATLERRVEETSAERDRIWRISAELMLVARFDATVLAVNPAWTTTLGWTEGELLGTRFSDLVHPDDVAQTVAEAGRIADGHVTLRFENRYRHKDGSYRMLSWTAVAAAGMIHAIARDVTAEKEAEAALRRAEEQLRQSQKMEAVGQLTGGLAHDFNNLLTVVTGNLELAQRRLGGAASDARLAGNLRNALEGAQRAATLTHRLLAFSRQSPLRPQVVCLNDVVAGMLDLIGRTLGEHIAVQTALCPTLFLAEADQNQVESAILNLCINARDAMPEGGTLAIETANTVLDAADPAVARGDACAGDHAMIAIRDTGSGMPPDVQERAFEPFFTTKPVGKGTGLGLSQVFGFMRQSNGHVTLESAPGAGTTIRLFFPRLIGAPPGPAEPASKAGEVAASGRGESILVVEDQEMVREFTVAALEGSGYRVLSAGDGPSGLALLDGGAEVALLFTDVVLAGGMSGREVAAEARRRRPGLKVLYATGYARDEIIHDGRLDADVDLLIKPFTATTLVARVGRALGPRESAVREPAGTAAQ
jgi:PAS domain S-box-containing protein